MNKEEIKQDVELDEEVDEKVDETEESKETKTFTEEEVQSMIQAETDRKTTKALQTAKEKWEAEYQEKLKTEKSEAEKLASMSAEERAMAEFKKEKDSWLEEKKQFEKERMQLEATKMLSAEGLPVSFVEYVTGETAEEVTENIETFKTEWKKALEKEVSEKLRGKVPTGSALQSKDILSMTKAEFGKLPYKERARMLSVDPDIVSKLKN